MWRKWRGVSLRKWIGIQNQVKIVFYDRLAYVGQLSFPKPIRHLDLLDTNVTNKSTTPQP